MQASLRSKMPRGDTFFSRDKSFYRSFFTLFAILALQNVITYSVNVADNLMLGAYSQTALAGAAAVNQLQYVLQQVTNCGLSEGLVVLATQYWGKRETGPIQRLVGVAAAACLLVGGALTLAAFAAPRALVGLFTDDAEILAAGLEYLSVVRLTYLPFMLTSVLLASLRSVQIVGVAFRLSVMALLVNVAINWTLIFGRFGAPELGIFGAGIGTLVSRWLELIVLLVYLSRAKLPFRFSLRRMFPLDRALARDYIRVAVPCVVSSLLFSISIAMQTAVLGHLSADAIAANSVSSTLFQYCKMIPLAASSSAGVWIGGLVGRGEFKQLRSYVRTLQWMFWALGFMMGGLMLAIRTPILSLYDLTEQASIYANQLMVVMAAVSVATGIQMPSLTGIVRGGGDANYVLYNDIFYCSLVSIPFCLLAAFVLDWPVWALVLGMNADQFLKCFSSTYKVNRYTWIRRRTADAVND